MSPSGSRSASARPFLGGWYALVPIVALAAARDLWAPDEPRYAQIAREAFESGSFLVLHLCGEVYPDKPPLVYWLAGAMGRLGEWSELALRAPSILATAGSAWLAARIARRLLGTGVAAWTPLFFLGLALVAWSGARLQLDPLLSFFCLAAVERAWCEGGDGAQRTRRALLAGLACGLAALCKGPVAWLHVGLALLAWKLVPRPARGSIGWSAGAWVGFVALAVVPVTAWAAAASLAEPSLARPLFLGQHLGRAATLDAPHAGPPWEHAVELLAFLLPWTPLVLAGIGAAWSAWRAARRGSDEHAGLVRAATWFALVFAVFSALPPKREVYLLPIYPVAAWLAAFAFQRALATGNLPRLVGPAVTGLLLVLGLAAAIGPRFVAAAAPFADAALAPAIGLAAGAGGAWAFLRRGNLARWADSIALGVSASALLAAITLVPRIDPIKSARALAAVVAARPEKPDAIPCIGVQPEGYRFYAGIPTVHGGVDDLRRGPAREGARFLALVGEREWDRLPDPVRGALAVLERRRVGSRDVLVVGSR